MCFFPCGAGSLTGRFTLFTCSFASILQLFLLLVTCRMDRFYFLFLGVMDLGRTTLRCFLAARCGVDRRIDEHAQTCAEHPHILGNSSTIRAWADAVFLRHARSVQVHVEQSG